MASSENIHPQNVNKSRNNITTNTRNKNLNNIQVTKKILIEAKKIINLGNKVQIKFVKDRPGHDVRYALNSDKIKSELGWRPKTSFSEGIKLTLNWYIENKSYYKSISKKDIINRLGN